ncbi:MAG: exosome complex protein Rrp42 [Sulfolobales archaeon]
MSMTPTNLPIIPKIRKNAILTLLSKGTRIDERGFEDHRNISFRTGLIPNANGSAYLELGETKVLVGVKIEIGSPFPDTPEEGNLIVNAEFLPLASPVFEPGPPDERAVELARVIDRSLRDGRAIDLSKLVIIPGRKVWNLFIDIYIVDYDGNVVDASSLATLLALMTAGVPKVSVDQSTGEISYSKKEFEPLPIQRRVVTSTIAKITDENTGARYYLSDPSLEEEMISDTLVTIAYSEDGRIVGMQKNGIQSIHQDDIGRIIAQARRLSERYFTRLKELLEVAGKEERGSISTSQ